MSKIRERYGLIIFQKFFEHIVEACIEAGLVWGKELHFDGTLVEANADYDSQVPRFYWAAREHLHTLFQATSSPQTEVTDRHFVHKYSGQQRMVKASGYRRKRDYWVCPTDPDASPMGKFKLGYRTHYVVDGGKARIILACLTTPTTIQDNTPMIDLAWWVRFRWHLSLRVAVADQKYGTIENIVALEDNGIRAYMPLHADASGKRKGVFPRSAFTYDSERDCYICPQGETLLLRRSNDRTQTHHYSAGSKVCGKCPIREQCSTSKRGREISHSYFKDYLDRVKGYHETEAYKRAMRKRQVWVEPKFAESKLWHQGRRFRWRRIDKVNIEALLRASVQNLKQLLRHQPRTNPLNPTPIQQIGRFTSHFSIGMC